MTRHFTLKTKPDEVHALRTRDWRVMSECTNVGVEASLEPSDIVVVTKPLTCDGCIEQVEAQQLVHETPGQHCIHSEPDCEVAVDSESHGENCHHCGAKLQLPYNWRVDSPAPQITRRETY